MSLLVKCLHAVFHPLARLRIFLYKNDFFSTTSLPGMVISIGNLTLGGTGKTPVVVSLARGLMEQGARPVVLARGYRSGLKKHQAALLCNSSLTGLLGHPEPDQLHPDEARLVAKSVKNLPVIIGADRVGAARAYLLEHPTPSHWILEDGFQHLCIERDVDILLFDAQDPLGQKQRVVHRILREPLTSISRCDIVFLTRWQDDLANQEFSKALMESGVRYQKIPFRSEAEVLQNLKDFGARKTLGVLSAIANPERFYKSLISAGIRVQCQRTKLDHHLFTQDELSRFGSSLDGLVTTSKDYWRQPKIFDQLTPKIFVVPIEAALPGDFIRSVSQG